jgi:hypothetical protein
MKRNTFILVAIAAVAASVALAGCSAINAAAADPIVGTWQQSPSLATTLQFTENPNNYTYATGVIQTNTGTWSKSGSTYSLTGAILGFIGTSSSITPTFSNSNNTFAYTDSNSVIQIYNRK